MNEKFKQKKELRKYGLSELGVDAFFRANGFCNQFGMEEVLNFDTSKKLLFMAYFARYYILKESYETNRLLNHPAVEDMARLPIIRNVVKSLDEDNFATKETAALLEKIAKDIAKKIIEKKALLSEGVSAGGKKYDLSISQIESAANFMSTAVIEHEHHKNKSQDLKQIMEEIKERYKKDN